MIFKLEVNLNILFFFIRHPSLEAATHNKSNISPRKYERE